MSDKTYYNCKCGSKIAVTRSHVTGKRPFPKCKHCKPTDLKPIIMDAKKKFMRRDMIKMANNL